MAQFTPPQNDMSQLINTLILDKLRQQQWERSQNALIQKELRAQEYKYAAEDRKEQRKLMLEAAKAGVFVPPGGGISELAALQGIAQSAQIGQQEKIDKALMPLAENLAQPVSVAQSLQGKVSRGGTLSPQEYERLRQAAQTASPLSALAGEYGTRTGVLAAGVAESRRQKFAELQDQARKEAEAPFRQIDVGLGREEALKREIADMAARKKIGTPEWNQKVREFELISGRTERSAFGDQEQQITIGPDGTISISKGTRRPSAGQIQRVYDNVQNSDKIGDDLRNILEAYDKDQTTLGAAAALQHFLYNLQGLADDFSTMVANDAARPDVIQEGQVSAIQAAVTTGNITGLKLLEPKEFDHIKTDIIHGHKLTELRLAYYFVRMNRGNGRVTAKEIADAMDRLALVRWTKSSRQVAANMRQFLFYVDREAEFGRKSAKKLLDLDIPKEPRTSPWQPTPLPPEEEREEPTAPKGTIRGALESLDVGENLDKWKKKIGLGGGE